MSEIEETLFYYQSSNPKEFEVQFATVFETASYAYNGWQIIKSPTSANNTLEIKLMVKTGNDQEIVHQIPIGTFPNQISTWNLEVTYYDESGIKIKDKGNTEQAEATAKPKPFPVSV